MATRPLKQRRRRAARWFFLRVVLLLLAGVGIAYSAWFAKWARPIAQVRVSSETGR